MKRTSRYTASALVLTLLSVNACAQDVKVMISGGFKAALEKLAPYRACHYVVWLWAIDQLVPAHAHVLGFCTRWHLDARYAGA